MNLIKIGSLIFFMSFMQIQAYSTHVRKFYVNAQSGKDTNPGTRKKPFQSIGKVNKLQLKGRNSIHFAGGQTFEGTLQLSEVSGKSRNPIVISSYGDGHAILNGGKQQAIWAEDCSWLSIESLTLKGDGRLAGNTGSGIELRNSQNCRIDSIEASGFLWSGIKVVGGANLQITNVYAHDNGFSGINVESDGQDSGGLEGSGGKTFRSLYIGHCIAENNPGCPMVKDNHSGNGILIGGVTNGMIEYCEAMNNGWDMPREGNGPVGIWAYQCDSITIQNCYSHDNKTSEKGKDGGGFDFDGGVTNSVMQNNLSANNEGAGYGLFQYNGASVWKNNTVRNNISYNDGKKNGHAGFLMWIDPASPQPISDCEIVGNTVVNCFGHAVSFEPGDYPAFNFSNNIFMLTKNAVSFINGKYKGASFSGNQAWVVGQYIPLAFPEDPKAILTDPKIKLPENNKELPENVAELKQLNLFRVQ